MRVILDNFEYVFSGYMILKKKKIKGSLYFIEHNLFFREDGNDLLKWDKIFYNDIIINI